MPILLCYLTCISTASIIIDSIPNIGTPASAFKSSTMATYGEQLLIFGGKIDSESLHDELFLYDFGKGIWNKLRPIDYPWPGIIYLAERYSLTSFVIGSDFCIYGGNSLRGPLVDIWCINPQALVWRKIENTGKTPSPRYMSGFTVFAYEGVNYMAIYGGFKRADVSSGIHL